MVLATRSVQAEVTRWCRGVGVSVRGRLTTYSSSYPSSAGTPVSGSQSRTVNFMVQLKVPATEGERAGEPESGLGRAQRLREERGKHRQHTALGSVSPTGTRAGSASLVVAPRAARRLASKAASQNDFKNHSPL